MKADEGELWSSAALLAGLFCCYLQRATQTWTWEHRDCHALGVSTLAVQEKLQNTPTHGHKDWGEKSQGKSEYKRMTCSWTYHLLAEWNTISRKWDKAAQLRTTAAKKQIPFCHLPASKYLISQLQHYFHTVLLLGQLYPSVHREHQHYFQQNHLQNTAASLDTLIFRPIACQFTIKIWILP